MPEVRALSSFYDMQDKSARNSGDEWYCEEERAEQLAAYGMVAILGLPKEEPAPAPIPEPEPEPETVEEVAPEAEEAAEEQPKKRSKKKVED